jgi:mono/diheme cytochrome c family protein
MTVPQPKNLRHHPNRWRSYVGGALLLAILAGCEPPGKPNPANRPVTPNQISNFTELYATNCAGCHGADGELGPAPPLNDPLFLSIIPPSELTAIIRDGRPGTPMPAFAQLNGGALTEAQVRILADGIASNWKSPVELNITPPAYLLAKSDDAEPTPGDPQRGAEVFARACAGCHGTNGAGADQDNSMGGAINVPAFLALISDQALRRIIITGRPDLGMPTFAEPTGRPDDFQPLTPAEIDDLVALMAAWRASTGIVNVDRER